MKKIINIIVIVMLPFILSSCDSVLSWIGAYMCSLAPDSDHCFQWTAGQSGNTEDCDKIKWTKFKAGGSNPPRDKCYLMVAENTGNYNACNKIKWWLMSYTVSGCISGTAIKKDDPIGCTKLPAWSADYTACVSGLATTDKVKTKNEEFDKLREELGDDPGNKELRKKYDALKNDLNTRYDLMNPTDRANYFKEKREGLMKDIDDEDVKQSIAQTYNNYKVANSGAKYTDLITNLKDVTEKQQLIKELDDTANTLTDTIKETMTNVVNDKKDEYLDGAKEKWQEWLDKNLTNDMKNKLTKLQGMKDKFDKWSEMYNDVNKKYESFKKAYDEIKALNDKAKEFDKMVGEWKIDAWQAKVLKWATLLNKWLEYTTQYVPVFGSTISTVSKATFDTVIKVATKRAERTNSMQKCIDDPLNCDPSTISAY